MKINQIINGDCLEKLKEMPGESVDCVVTSPPYWALRDYGVVGQLGLEPTFQEYITKLCDIFDEVKRVLKKEGTCWVNIGDSYAGGKIGRDDYGDSTSGLNNAKKGSGKTGTHHSTPTRQRILPDVPGKCLVQIPSRFAIEMTNRGWILRNEIIWHKPSCMPQSVTDRFTVDFEKIFFFTKSRKYYFEQQKEPTKTKDTNIRNRDIGKLNSTPGRTRMGGLTHNNHDTRNVRTVWSINPKPFKEAHFATFPEALIETPIKAGCPIDGLVLDPFMGACTTALVAKKLGRNYIGIELNADYIKICEDRLAPVDKLPLHKVAQLI